MTTAFVGYKLLLDVSGGIVVVTVIGALVATIGAFGPSFAFIIGFFPYFAKVRKNALVQTALVAVNAAVIGAILGATVILAEESFLVEQPTVPVPVAGAVLDLFVVLLALVTYWLFVRGVHAAYLIAAGARSASGRSSSCSTHRPEYDRRITSEV
uniref:chromate transporter n=1 Tax=Natronococcus occultus TaxID=29288 RepID=UPI0006781647|nr:chromate transporter [Natronococcus occultus]